MHGATALAHQANELRVAFDHVGANLTTRDVPFLGGFELQSREPNDAALLWGFSGHKMFSEICLGMWRDREI